MHELLVFPEWNWKGISWTLKGSDGKVTQKPKDWREGKAKEDKKRRVGGKWKEWR